MIVVVCVVFKRRQSPHSASQAHTNAAYMTSEEPGAEVIPTVTLNMEKNHGQSPYDYEPHYTGLKVGRALPPTPNQDEDKVHDEDEYQDVVLR